MARRWAAYCEDVSTGSEARSTVEYKGGCSFAFSSKVSLWPSEETITLAHQSKRDSRWLIRSNNDAYSVAPYHSSIINQNWLQILGMYKGWAAERSLNSQPQREFCFLHARMLLCGGAGSWWRWRGDCSHCPRPGFRRPEEKSISSYIYIFIHVYQCKVLYSCIYIVVADCLRCTPVPGTWYQVSYCLVYVVVH